MRENQAVAAQKIRISSLPPLLPGFPGHSPRPSGLPQDTNLHPAVLKGHCRFWRQASFGEVRLLPGPYRHYSPAHRQAGPLTSGRSHAGLSLHLKSVSCIPGCSRHSSDTTCTSLRLPPACSGCLCALRPLRHPQAAPVPSGGSGTAGTAPWRLLAMRQARGVVCLRRLNNLLK